MPPGPGVPAILLALLGAGCAAPRDDAALLAAAGRVERARGPGARFDAPAPADAPASAEPTGTGRVTWFPKGPLLYDAYLVAPRQSRTSVKTQSSLGDGRNAKVENSIGFDRSVVRWTDEGRPDEGTEVQFEAGVFARFDLHEEYDMDASDWRFGIPVVHRKGDVAWKFHVYHLTSHMGDEYMDRTGATPAAYHLEEAAGGVSWDASPGGRLYGEAGAALYTGEPTGSGRVQAGWEWAGVKGATGFSPWFAVDLSMRREQDWTPGTTVGVGVAYGRDVRFGVEFYDGRDTQTQFMLERVRYLSVGLTMDL